MWQYNFVDKINIFRKRSNPMEDKPVKIKDKLYYARVHHNTGTYDVCDLIVQSIRDTYFATTDKRDKHRYLFSYNDINKLIFFR